MCCAWRVAQRGFYVGLCLVTALAAGCAPVLVKPGALDEAALRERLPAENLLQQISGGEQILEPGPAWLAGIDPQQELTFLGVAGADDHNFGVLLEIDLEYGRLRYLPLPGDETPLTILTDPDRRAALEAFVKPWPDGLGRVSGPLVRDIPLTEIENRLVAPVPQPQQIFAVAANYPSHLFTDLALPEKADLITRLREARPRIFRKYPPVAAPGSSESAGQDYATLPGPFDAIAAPRRVHVPSLGGANRAVPGHLDYEVEIAVLVGRDLAWDQARKMSDQELREVVAGTLLFSDAKVRDPQAMGRIIRVYNEEELASDNPYRVGEEALDGTLGTWDELTCQWWSYAAGWGRYAAHGPFLVATSDPGKFLPRMLLSARSYTSAPDRHVPPPRGVPTGHLLLRQATLSTTAVDYPDALVWNVPQIIRSLLDPDGNALAFTGEAPALRAGDLIALGTPGGAVVSAKPWWLLPMAEDLLFWKGPDNFYDMFFAPTEGFYLHPGDELFLWGEGLGYQHLKVSIPEPGE